MKTCHICGIDYEDGDYWFHRMANTHRRLLEAKSKAAAKGARAARQARQKLA